MGVSLLSRGLPNFQGNASMIDPFDSHINSWPTSMSIIRPEEPYGVPLVRQLSIEPQNQYSLLNGLNGGETASGPVDESRVLFLGDLSYFCREEDIFALLAGYGPSAANIRRGLNGESLMHAFITLESAEATVAAAAVLDGVEFMGRNMR